MSNEVEKPIINSPYDEPAQHWKIHPFEPPDLIKVRRPATYLYNAPNAKAKQGRQSATEVALPMVDAIRAQLEVWRPLALRGEGGVSRVTMDLLRYWEREGREHPLFFAQREAAETIIFLTEARADFLQGINVPSDRDGKKELQRFCCKMATGSGKTTVMAMLAAWSILNKVNYRNDARFSTAVLVVCPNVTIRERLAELDPNKGEASIYRTRDLVPDRMMPQLQQGNVLVHNWHVFEPKTNSQRVVKTGKKQIIAEKIIIGTKNTTLRGKRYMTENELRQQANLGYITVKYENKDEQGNLVSADVVSVRYVESDNALVKRLLQPTFGGQKNILVFNDEAHHAYRLQNAADDADGGDMFGEIEQEDEYYRQATIWIEGLDKIHAARGINRCIDFSATPYFLQHAGENSNRIFPWTVSNFGLEDAIEAGLVKIPQLAVRDTSGQDVPGYSNIWDWIMRQMTTAERGGKRSEAKPDAILKYAHTPIAMLAGTWEEVRREWAESDEVRPPVFIIVCKTTKLAQVVFEWLAEDKPPVIGIPKAQLPSLQNRDGRINTIRVDSKVNNELEGGKSKGDETRWMRYTLDTIGKTSWPSDEQKKPIYPDGFAELARKLKREQFLQYPPGRDVRCIVSVGMLTEGWDCNTVTHIIGLRPFMSQLLCEQVIGRGLRRASYDTGDDGLMSEEIATVLGVPLTTFPIKASEKGGRDKVKKYRIYALPNKKEYEISFPRVEGYYQKIDSRVVCDFNSVPELPIDGVKIPAEVEMKAGLPDNTGRMSLHGPGGIDTVSMQSFRNQFRKQKFLFEMTERLVAHYSSKNCSVPAGILFRQLYNIANTYIEQKVVASNKAQKCDVFMSPYYGYMIERLLEHIKPDVDAGEAPELPRYERSRPVGSSADVDFWTKRKPYNVIKSHVNAVVPDTKVLEQTAAYILDTHERVRAFVKNEQMGFGIPYMHNGETHDYLPDFIVVLDNELRLIVETKGFDELKEVKKAAAIRWANAVNADGAHGVWAYEMVSNTNELVGVLNRYAGGGD